MKLVVTLMVSILCIFAATAQALQADTAGTKLKIPERTPQLENLYQQQDYLSENGTAQEIEANRLAIKDAWTAVDPQIGDLYKPLIAPNAGEDKTSYFLNRTIERPDTLPPTRDWGDDILVHDGFVDGLDMTLDLTSGDLYIAMYENDIDAGGTMNNIFIYRSTDNGITWNFFANVIPLTPIRKLQLMILDGIGDQYVLAYVLLEDGDFLAIRWETTPVDFQFELITNNVSDFSVDRNFPESTSSMRVLATYLKDGFCTTEVFSARSTAGAYGFNWVDEVSVDNVCGAQIDFAYARAGDAFVTYTGAASGNLFVNTNDAFNDPTSWTPRETVEFGTIRETINPTIRAARLALPNENVVVFTSDRADGSTDAFDGQAYRRQSGGMFSSFYSIGSPNFDIVHADGWIRRTTGVETIRFSFVRDYVDNSENEENYPLTFNGTKFDDDKEPVADSPIDVFNGFPSVIAETANEEPCMAFAGTNAGRGFRLYFDTRSEVPLAVAENSIAGLTYFPNPTNDVLQIQANTALDKVEVYSITGAKVLDVQNIEQINSIVVNTSNLADGIYVMKVTAGLQTGTYKVVKQ